MGQKQLKNKYQVTQIKILTSSFDSNNLSLVKNKLLCKIWVNYDGIAKSVVFL